MSNHQGRGVAVAKNSAESAHTRRVTAWCAEIATRLGMNGPDRDILELCVALHHRTKLTVDDSAWSALRIELGMALGRSSTAVPQDEVMQVLQALHGHRPHSERIKKLSLILDQCDDLDAASELDATVSGEPELNGLESIVSEMGGYFTHVTEEQLEQAAARLPVFPAVAFRAIRLLGDVEANLDDVESLVATDQTLAGHVIRAANSVFSSTAHRVKSVREAVTRIGLETARQIVSAASLRKLFESKQSQTLWNHSLCVAESAANIAAQSGVVSRDEAFLAGLMHDVGKLIILNLCDSAQDSRDRLTQNGCPGPIVERVILGLDHAAIGGRLLRNWKFAETTVAAVEMHHTPELNASPLSSIVYLAENYPGQIHGIESLWRERMARGKAGLREEERPHNSAGTSLVAGLRFSAAA